MDRIIDGDTIDVRVGSEVERVRLIGIDTPERGQPFFQAATQLAETLAPPGTRVFLELDVEERDRYGRLLAYVWVNGSPTETGEMINETIMESGVAVTLTIPPNVRYAERFLKAQRLARSQNKGLWRR